MPGSTYKGSAGLGFLALSLLCVIDNHRVLAAPQPVPPGMMFREDYAPPETDRLLDKMQNILRIKEERVAKELEELAEDQMNFQEFLAQNRREHEHQLQPPQQLQQEISEEDPQETLPVPAAVYHHAPLQSGKRTSFMALCHFKICNMGRKRQL